MDLPSFTRGTIKIPSVEPGVHLDVWFYMPTTPGPWPVVVAGHGLSLIKAAGLAPFAEAWAAQAGYASLVMDYRCVGDSEGEPRNFLSVVKQTEDYKSVISWAHARPETFKIDKILVWGSAMSGLNVAELVVSDDRVAGGMAHCAILDGYRLITSLPPNYTLIFYAWMDWLKGRLGFKQPIWIPVVAKPGEFAYLTSPDTLTGFENMWAQSGAPFSSAPNVLPARLVWEVLAARPGARLKEARSPMLVVMPEDDDLLDPKLTRAIVNEAGGKVKLVPVSGGHYDIMKGGKAFEANLAAQVEFMKDLLTSHKAA